VTSLPLRDPPLLPPTRLARPDCQFNVHGPRPRIVGTAQTVLPHVFDTAFCATPVFFVLEALTIGIVEFRRVTLCKPKFYQLQGSRRHPDIRVKHCSYGNSVATLLNPRGVTTVSHKHSLTVAIHATVVVAVPSAVCYPANYKIKYIKMKFKSVDTLLTLITYYKLLTVSSQESVLLQLSVL
jgi:hypothetical protein